MTNTDKELIELSFEQKTMDKLMWLLSDLGLTMTAEHNQVISDAWKIIRQQHGMINKFKDRATIDAVNASRGQEPVYQVWDSTRAAVEIKRLREWIRAEGERNNTCTFNVLGEVCGYCECAKRTR